MAEYLENEPARKRAAAEAQKAKLEALERKLGIQGVDVSSGASSSKVTTEEAEASTDERSGTRQRASPGELPQVAGKKHRFDDTEYLEQSREIVDNVKSAVSAGKRRLIS